MGVAGALALALLLGLSVVLFLWLRMRRRLRALEARLRALERGLRQPGPGAGPGPADSFAERAMAWLGGAGLALGGVAAALWAAAREAPLALAAVSALALAALLAGLGARGGDEGSRALRAALAAAGLVGLFGVVLAARRLALLAPEPALWVLAVLVLVALGRARLGPLLVAVVAAAGYAAPVVAGVEVVDRPQGVFAYLALLTAVAQLQAHRSGGWWVGALVVLPGALLWAAAAGAAAVFGLLTLGQAPALARPLAALVVALGLFSAPALALIMGRAEPAPRRARAAAAFVLAHALLLAGLVLEAGERELVPLLALMALQLGALLASALKPDFKAPALVAAAAPLLIAALHDAQDPVWPRLLAEPSLLPPALRLAAGDLGLWGLVLSTFILFAVFGPAMAALRPRDGGLWAAVGALVPLLAMGVLAFRLGVPELYGLFPVLFLAYGLLQLLAAMVAWVRGQGEGVVAAHGFAAALASLFAGLMWLELPLLRLLLAPAAVVAATFHRLQPKPVFAAITGGAIAAFAVLLVVPGRFGTVPELSVLLWSGVFPLLGCALALWTLGPQAWIARSLGTACLWLAGAAALALAALVTNGMAVALRDHAPTDRGLALVAWLSAAGVFAALASRGVLPARLQRLWLPFALLALPSLFRLLLGDANPARTAVDIGLLPFVDGLLVPYGLGALTAFGLAALLFPGERGAARAIGGVGLVLLLLWIRYEIQHLVQGAVIVRELGAVERALVAAGWLAVAGLLAAAALWRREVAELSWAAVAVALLALFEGLSAALEETEGLLRALLFAVLGLLLLAAARLYRRLAPVRRTRSC